MFPSVFVSFLAVFAVTAASSGGAAQGPLALPSPNQARELVREVALYQEASLLHKNEHFRYRTHRVDPKEDTTRDLIESSDGNIARLVLHNGRPLTTDENSGERHRLEKLLTSGDLANRQKEDQKSHSYGVELIHAMPQAMIYIPAAEQPQLPDLERRQLVFDFVPDPAFRPRTIAEGALGSLSGRIWIDEADHHLVRLELTVSRDLNLAWGMLVKVYKGGTIEYDQRRVSEGVYCFSHIRTHMLLREFMIKNVPYDSDLTASDISVLAPVPNGAEAVRTLLNENVPTR